MERVRIAESVYSDKYGLDARVKVHGVQRTKRFPFETTLDTIKTWQDRTRADLREQTAAPSAPPPAHGTLAAVAPRYLSQIAGRASFKSDESHLRAWLALYGKWPLARIHAEHVNNAFSQWQTEGYADQTLTHRKRVLRELHQMVCGKKAYCPTEDARRIPKPVPKPVFVADEIINAVDEKFQAMNLPVEYAIFRVLATTGQRPCQLNRAKPTDVNLKAGVWNVPSAKGERQHPIYLNPEMIAAWKLFIAANAWGKVDTCQQAKIMRRCGWPWDVRPYNMRHSFAASAMARGADIGDLQLLLGHHQLETTRRSYAAGQETRMRRMSTLVNGRFNQPEPPLKLVQSEKKA